jgi:membrane-bound metal-dependent hydrolase YbcI (DUF457 family)
MRRGIHLAIGIGIFFLYSWFIIRFRPDAGALFLFGIVAVAAGSVLPDIVEPAITSHHRGFFHSKGVLACTLFVLVVTVLVEKDPSLLPASSQLSFTQLWFISSFFLGYAFHLLADSLTPAGLPG